MIYEISQHQFNPDSIAVNIVKVNLYLGKHPTGEMSEYSNRVPISVNGNHAEAVVSSGSNIPNCWMSFAYFSRIGFGRNHITQIFGVDRVEDGSGNEFTVLGVPNCVLDLKIGDCPKSFKVRPFIIEFENEGYTQCRRV